MTFFEFFHKHRFKILGCVCFVVGFYAGNGATIAYKTSQFLREHRALLEKQEKERKKKESENPKIKVMSFKERWKRLDEASEKAKKRKALMYIERAKRRKENKNSTLRDPKEVIQKFQEDSKRDRDEWLQKREKTEEEMREESPHSPLWKNHVPLKDQPIRAQRSLPIQAEKKVEATQK